MKSTIKKPLQVNKAHEWFTAVERCVKHTSVFSFVSYKRKYRRILKVTLKPQNLTPFLKTYAFYVEYVLEMK